MKFVRERDHGCTSPSPSVWRVWIEILECEHIPENPPQSPSVWRVWIEITLDDYISNKARSHPPCGGCGLKSVYFDFEYDSERSPSVWRVWIEIQEEEKEKTFDECHPPCGGCGLKSATTSKCSVLSTVTLRVEGVG